MDKKDEIKRDDGMTKTDEVERDDGMTEKDEIERDDRKTKKNEIERGDGMTKQDKIVIITHHHCHTNQRTHLPCMNRALFISHSFLPYQRHI